MARSLAAAFSIAMLVGAAGCAPKAAPPPTAPAAITASVHQTWAESLFTYDDPRATGDDIRAMREAAKALLGPSADKSSAQDLRFAVTIVGDGWQVDVWHIDPAVVLGVSGFKSVRMGHDFTGAKVVGT